MISECLVKKFLRVKQMTVVKKVIAFAKNPGLFPKKKNHIWMLTPTVIPIEGF